MSLLKVYESFSGQSGYHIIEFHCPGCNRQHPYRVANEGVTPEQVRQQTNGPCWDFNGDMEKPTFSPSLLCDASSPQHRCHLFVKNGRIEYCGDCHHSLAGKTVDMVPIPSYE